MGRIHDLRLSVTGSKQGLQAVKIFLGPKYHGEFLGDCLAIKGA